MTEPIFWVVSAAQYTPPIKLRSHCSSELASRLPLDVLNQSLATELAPLSALTQLAGAAAGGTSVQTGSSSSPKVGGGLFGK